MRSRTRAPVTEAARLATRAAAACSRRWGAGNSCPGEQDSDVSAAATLVGRFVDLIRGSSVGRKARAPRATFRKWLSEATKSKVSAIATFAAGLEQDGAAVRAALTTPWSSGQAEGQITRLKLLKRQTYGRASFDLLRRRTLLAA